MSNLGMGVMLGMLGGNSETVEAIKPSLGKKIQSVKLDEEKMALDNLSKHIFKK